jgi:hypothetical protein
MKSGFFSFPHFSRPTVPKINILNEFLSHLSSDEFFFIPQHTRKNFIRNFSTHRKLRENSFPCKQDGEGYKRRNYTKMWFFFVDIVVWERRELKNELKNDAA